MENSIITINVTLSEFEAMLNHESVRIITEEKMEIMYGRIFLALSDIPEGAKMNDNDWEKILEAAAMIGNGDIKVVNNLNYLDLANTTNIVLDNVKQFSCTDFISYLRNCCNYTGNIYTFCKENGKFIIEKCI